ncbi:MAG: leucyl aminopeptidase [bacterium]
MKFNFAYKTLESVPKGYVRVVLTEEARGTKRFVREVGKDGEVLSLEIGAGFLLSANKDKKGGKQDEKAHRKFTLLCRSIVRAAMEQKIKKIAIQFDRTPELFASLQKLTPEAISSRAAQAFEMAGYEHNTFKTKPKDGWHEVEEIALCGASSPSIERAAQRGQMIGQSVNACRELSNTPGGHMTPKVLAEAAKKAAKEAGAGSKLSVKVLGQKEIEKLGMGGVLGIAKGSALEPQFIVMEYWGAAKSEKPVVLVGKGVTFDSGGLNMKPGDHMYEMHMDMSGGAAVIHTLALAAKLKLKANVVGLVPAVENMPGQNAVRPGDILKSMSGKTIEVLNTDAEGRVILADGITYAKKYNPKAVIDVATLTGASLIALGTEASAFMTNDEGKILDIVQAGEKSGDHMWPFPAWEEYEAMVKGNFGDVPNISTDGNSRYGGVIAGGMFLREFAKDLDCLWVHIDMAPRMVSNANEYLAKGAAGAPVRFLFAFIESGVE